MSKFVKAINTTKNIVIVSRVRVANNPVTRFLGLLPESHLPEDDGLLLVPCRSIHSYFMRFIFDAVFIDKTNKVVHLIENMKPWTASSYIWKSKKVLELPAGTISRKSIEINDIIEFM